MRSSLVKYVAVGGPASRWTHGLLAALYLLLVGCILLIVAAYAQSDRGSITGTVIDPVGAVVPGAKVTATNTLTGARTETVATATGNYELSFLPAGTYNIIVEMAGFRALLRKGIEVQVAQTARVDLKLELGSPTESVTVTAEAPMLRTENAEQSMNVSGKKVNDLPLNFGGGGNTGIGIRNWLSFMYLAPGVSGTNVNSPGNNVVNGIPAGTDGNFKVYLEGQDATSINDAGWTATVSAASVETITEFAVQSSNFSAEFGQVGRPCQFHHQGRNQPAPWHRLRGVGQRGPRRSPIRLTIR